MGALEGEEELEGGVAVSEGALNLVFEFDEDLVVPVEALEGVEPVVFSEEAFLVGIDFGEQLLSESQGQVEATQSLVLVQELLELFESHFLQVLGCLLKALFD